MLADAGPNGNGTNRATWRPMLHASIWRIPRGDTLVVTQTATRDPAGFLPLAQYACLGDGRSVALVGADGSIDWWAVPNLDSPPLFDRLLDPVHGGRFSITPVGAYTVERRYRPNSNVLEQVFTTADGSARITDSLNSGISGRLPWSELARRIEGLTGSVTFEIAAVTGRRLDKANSWREPSPHGDVLHLGNIILAFRAHEAVQRTQEDDRGVKARLVTQPGSRTITALLGTSDEPLILPTLAAIDARIDRSDQAWREWTSNLSVEAGYADELRRSALALKLLLFSPTGSIAAAATTSLPEKIGGKKNWDYRFAWARDVTYTIKAFLRVGATEEAQAAFGWLTATVRRHGVMKTMYKLDGSDAPDAAELDLPGYRGSKPVQSGNLAGSQLQLGTFGDLLETAAMFVREGHVLDLTTRRLLAEQADRCADSWRQKDSGIWELQEQEHYTISKIGCWTGLDRAAWLAERGQIDSSHADRWKRERDRIQDYIDTECWSEAKQSYTLHAGSEKLDAAVLLGVPFGLPRRERLLTTCKAIQQELSSGPHLYRYTGMQTEEGTFMACGFWLAEALAILGETVAARQQMDALLRATGGNLGLLTEQMDADTDEMLGNVPQALSHLALVHAATAITGVPPRDSARE